MKKSKSWLVAAAVVLAMTVIAPLAVLVTGHTDYLLPVAEFGGYLAAGVALLVTVGHAFLHFVAGSKRVSKLRSTKARSVLMSAWREQSNWGNLELYYPIVRGVVQAVLLTALGMGALGAAVFAAVCSTLLRRGALDRFMEREAMRDRRNR